MKQHDMTSKVMTTRFSLFAELERDLISLRTKEALANKRAQGISLGKPKGTVQKSKFDQDIIIIKELLNLGLSVRKTAIFFGIAIILVLTPMWLNAICESLLT